MLMGRLEPAAVLAALDSHPPAERELIFERFHRAAPGEGAGLGLAIGSAIVRGTRGGWLVGASPLGGARVGVLWPAVGGDKRLRLGTHTGVHP